MNYTFSLYDSGQITLPKEFRERYSTKKYMGVEKDGGIFIKPILHDQKSIADYWESPNVNIEENKAEWKIRFKKGIPASILALARECFVCLKYTICKLIKRMPVQFCQPGYVLLEVGENGSCYRFGY